MKNVQYSEIPKWQTKTSHCSAGLQKLAQKKKKKKKNSNCNILPNNFAILCNFLNLILPSRTPQNYLLSSTSWKFGHKFRKFYSFQIKIKILSSTPWKFLVEHVSEIGEKILKIVAVLTPNSFFCIFFFMYKYTC